MLRQKYKLFRQLHKIRNHISDERLLRHLKAMSTGLSSKLLCKCLFLQAQEIFLRLPASGKQHKQKATSRPSIQSLRRRVPSDNPCTSKRVSIRDKLNLSLPCRRRREALNVQTPAQELHKACPIRRELQDA